MHQQFSRLYEVITGCYVALSEQPELRTDASPARKGCDRIRKPAVVRFIVCEMLNGGLVVPTRPHITMRFARIIGCAVHFRALGASIMRVTLSHNLPVKIGALFLPLSTDGTVVYQCRVNCLPAPWRASQCLLARVFVPTLLQSLAYCSGASGRVIIATSRPGVLLA